MFFLYRDFLCIDVIPNIQDNIYAQKNLLCRIQVPRCILKRKRPQRGLKGEFITCYLSCKKHHNDDSMLSFIEHAR